MKALGALAALLPCVALAHPWQAGPAAPFGPRLTSGAYDARRGIVVVFGGMDGVLHDDTWEYDGVGWVAGPAAPAGLAPRRMHVMVFDHRRGVTTLIGGDGASGAVYRDVWVYDGSSWAFGLQPPAPFAARTKAAACYDLGQGAVVLFGGGNRTGRLADTWELGAAGWSPGPAAPAGLTARLSHGMAYHLGTRRVVLFGGFDGVLRNDTWLFDGIAWSPAATPPSLGPRSGHTMTWEASPDRVLLFGGWNGVYLAEAWEFDGSAWVAGGAAPPSLEARYAPAVAYDSARGRAVIFGGFDGKTPYFGDLWEYGADEHYLVGAGLGAPNPNRIRTFESDGSPGGLDILAYAAGAWGVNVASGSVDGGSREEILAGPGPGEVFGPQVRGFLSDGAPMGKLNFYAYGTLKYGVGTAAEGTDADGFREIVTGAGPGDVFGPHVRGFDFDGAGLAPNAKVSFFSYATLKYGVDADGGDVDGDGFDEILTAPGPGPIFGPQVRGFDVDGGAAASIAKINFAAFATTQYGAQVAGGFVDLDGFAEIGAAPGAGPALGDRYRCFDFDAAAVTLIAGIDFTSFGTLHGGRVGFADIVSGVKMDLLVAPGPDPAAPSTVEAHTWDGSVLAEVPGAFEAFAGWRFGANVAGHLCGP